ncbi:MAG: DNA2/NAM7 family helicase, partial [Acidimicrobiia bacterium]|nr:DNA2/NAM7 family helicase [Acidimicrobiia bacterium]
RRAVAALGRALPAGRNRRRELLAAIDASALVRALPLWVGTLRDVDDLLPVDPAMFDVVIVDEAAQVDQFSAAGALLRGAAAVVVGDPRQLRHVSFVADADVAATLEERGVAELADRLDVRRMALFDVAAGAAPVTWLDEHFRSVPHLISFSARRFYDDRVLVATRNPVNESEDAVEVVRVGPGEEVAAAVDLIAALVAAGRRSIGAVSPFRESADALEAALVERFSPEQIVEAGLRAGTAHSFQGGERDHVVVVLGLSADDPANRWRFVEDPNLFNVLVTRARHRLTVVTALPPDGARPGIVADYLRHAQSPPAPVPATEADAAWVAQLASELARHEIAVRPGYRVGRWAVDLCAGTGAAAVALDCVPHAEGPAAHIARHRALRLAGWSVIDAFPSRWDGNAVEAAITLAADLAPGAADL